MQQKDGLVVGAETSEGREEEGESSSHEEKERKRG